MDFGRRGRGVDGFDVEVFGDFQIGIVDFVLEVERFRFESVFFRVVVATDLTGKASFVVESEDDSVGRRDVFGGHELFGEADDFRTRNTLAVTLVGES